MQDSAATKVDHLSVRFLIRLLLQPLNTSSMVCVCYNAKLRNFKKQLRNMYRKLY